MALTSSTIQVSWHPPEIHLREVFNSSVSHLKLLFQCCNLPQLPNHVSAICHLVFHFVVFQVGFKWGMAVVGSSPPHLSSHFKLQIKMQKRKLSSEMGLLNTLQERHHQGLQGPLRAAPPGGPVCRPARAAQDLAAVDGDDGAGEPAQVLQLQHPGSRLHRRRRRALLSPHRLRHSQRW